VIAILKDDYDLAASADLELDFIDYGDVETKNASEVCDLKTEFLALNFQAIECAMADIEPA
jgi:tudor domain-containing protein 2